MAMWARRREGSLVVRDLDAVRREFHFEAEQRRPGGDLAPHSFAREFETAAILGGTSLFGGSGSVVKTLAGALLLYSLTNGFNILNLGANYQGFVEGVVIVTAAAIYTIGGKR